MTKTGRNISKKFQKFSKKIQKNVKSGCAKTRDFIGTKRTFWKKKNPKK
jgi:hypothetical protein